MMMRQRTYFRLVSSLLALALLSTATARAADKGRVVEPLGKDTLLYFETTADRPFVAIVEGTEAHSAGEPVELDFPAESMFLFDSRGDRIR